MRRTLMIALICAGLVGACKPRTAPVPAPASPPAPPAGGPLIVFSSNRSGAWRIWTVKPDGSLLRRLTQARPGEHDVDPVFSPDGRRVLFTSTRGGSTGIWAMTEEGGDPRRICDGDQAEWGPDGKRIALRRGGRIIVRELAGGAEKTVTPEDWTLCSGPAWSPDGTTIAFACRWEAGNAIFTVPAGGGPKPAKVYDGQGACEPHYSPDGKWLVYETETHLAAIRPDGSDNRPVTWYGGIQRYGRFSPDGERIVFCQGPGPAGPWELYIVPAAGGTPARLTSGGSDMHPDWKQAGPES